MIFSNGNPSSRFWINIHGFLIMTMLSTELFEGAIVRKLSIPEDKAALINGCICFIIVALRYFVGYLLDRVGHRFIPHFLLLIATIVLLTAISIIVMDSKETDAEISDSLKLVIFSINFFSLKRS